jgi:hypothetical protein
MKIGQEVYLERMGNAARYSNEPIATEITKIGRKYITVAFNDYKFFIEDNEQFSPVYSADYKLYYSLEELSEKIEKRKLDSEVRQQFQYWGESAFTLDQLKRIKSIIEE